VLWSGLHYHAVVGPPLGDRVLDDDRGPHSQGSQWAHAPVIVSLQARLLRRSCVVQLAKRAPPLGIVGGVVDGEDVANVVAKKDLGRRPSSVAGGVAKREDAGSHPVGVGDGIAGCQGTPDDFLDCLDGSLGVVVGTVEVWRRGLEGNPPVLEKVLYLGRDQLAAVVGLEDRWDQVCDEDGTEVGHQDARPCPTLCN
jgi:hypothetical protein